MKIISKVQISILFLATFFVASCERENLTEVKPGFIERVKADPELSTLASAIEKANLQSALIGTQFTMFAPTNSAFNGVDINAIPAETLRQVLLYHIGGSRIDSSRFNPQYHGVTLNLSGVASLNTNLNANLYFTNVTRILNASDFPDRWRYESDGIFVCGSRIIGFDAVQASDGIVHKIDRVLFPPTGFLGEMIASNADLSLFNKLVNKAATAAGQPNFAATTLNLPIPSNVNPLTSRTGTLTVFAPTNAAMTAAGYTDAFIDGATPAACLNIARAQIINFRTFSSDFFNSARAFAPATVTVYNTLQTGRTVTFNLATTSFTGVLNANVQPSTANILAANGVIHVVGQVLNN